MKEKRNIVFIARSLDGYIADKGGGLDWMESTPNPGQIDMGYENLMSRVDAIVMGRNTYETVCSFDIEWPYSKPVFVMSRTLMSLPEKHQDNVSLVKGSISEILSELEQKEYTRLYIDGGATIQSFLKEDLIDEMIITTIPILLGGGIPLFADLPQELEFEHVGSEVYLDEIVQDHYRRKR